MKILITAGHTSVMIDQVRCISNIFKGGTGEAIARRLCTYPRYDNKTDVRNIVLLTSDETAHDRIGAWGDLKVVKYKTYDELMELMNFHIQFGGYDVIIHSAAVSDYRVAGMLDHEMKPVDMTSKMSGSMKECFVWMKPTEKIIDKIKSDWKFDGLLISFKLKVGIDDAELCDIAQKAGEHTKSDVVIANCLETKDKYVWLQMVESNNSVRIDKSGLPDAICTLVNSHSNKVYSDDKI